ncbi:MULTISPECIES: DNA-processing protein DprA [unclassified Campylobacter]|uniref:DNA-processing protein DprA n=1 Tax=unclassified Campylobacter TaxID=2593542 RepID=UPI001474CDFE|nr:DNA-processing protein DprA [Campylobacter sp. RM16187]QKG29031.1 DNA protecting protein DprA [Campylobacter sp. RM16187]
MNTLSKIPSQLNRLKNPPDQLYYKGNLELLNMPLVSIVGSRKASAYTKDCVFNLAKILSYSGVCVVSGAAIGVDIAAHKGAFPNTIAVFGNGLDRIYPQSNAKMIDEIYRNSLAITEYAPDVTPRGYQFLQRNRIVVALSQALIVAQADLLSGSMQSARMAYELGIKIYVLPQRINDSRGTNELLALKKAELINDFDKFATRFGEVANVTKDEILEFCKNGVDLDDALAKFGSQIYEYELLGRLKISGLRVNLA